nr:unnamed protein product [Digitaria exilis]
MSELKHPPSQHTLYTATRALGAMPRAVPAANPNRLACSTAAPAAVEEVWVPWPSSSRGELDSREVSMGPMAASADELAVAGGGVEVGAGDALAFPEGRDLAEAGVGVAGALRPHAGVEHADDHVRRRAGLREESGAGAIAGDAEELGGACGVELVPGLGEDGEDAVEGGEVAGLRRREARREAVEDGVSILLLAGETERSDAPYHSPWLAYSDGIADFAMWTMYVFRSSSPAAMVVVAAAATASASASARSVTVLPIFLCR